jgi:hypothetical protein
VTAKQVPRFAAQRLACEVHVGRGGTVVSIGSSTSPDDVDVTARLDEVPIGESMFYALDERMQRVPQ